MQRQEIGPGIYVHIPFCVRKCHYCDFNSQVAPASVRHSYLVALEREMALRAPEWAGVTFATVYFGGGTPTTYRPRPLAGILQRIREHFALARDAEITLEANPDTVTAADLEQLLEAGFNRLSLGVQSLRDEDLRFLGRIHDAAAAVRAFRAARVVGWRNINIDLIRGLPSHTAQRWRPVLERAVDLGPDHISCYGLTIEPGTELERRHHAGEFQMPDEGRQVELFELTAEVLGQAGYEHYEVSNWARPGYRCRHNLNYWLNGDYVGLGAGAWSHRGAVRWGNVPDVGQYVARARAGEDPTDEVDQPEAWPRVVEHAILALRLVGGVSWEHMAAAADGPSRDRLRQALRELARDGLVWFNDGGVGATRRGLLLLNEIGVRLL